MSPYPPKNGSQSRPYAQVLVTGKKKLRLDSKVEKQKHIHIILGCIFVFVRLSKLHP